MAVTNEDQEGTKLEIELASLKEVERQKQGAELIIENEWWSKEIIPNEEVALNNGKLVKVSLESPGYCLIGPLRREEEPNTLSPHAYALLNKISNLWLDKVSKALPHGPKVRLSISSLFRTVEWQRERVKKGINVAEFGPHESGMAIDFDPSGYYLGEGKKAVNKNNPGFDEIYANTLRELLIQLQDIGDCHVIWEKGHKIDGNHILVYDACWHVCVSPNFRS